MIRKFVSYGKKSQGQEALWAVQLSAVGKAPAAFPRGNNPLGLFPAAISTLAAWYLGLPHLGSQEGRPALAKTDSPHSAPW